MLVREFAEHTEGKRSRLPQLLQEALANETIAQQLELPRG